MRSTGIATPAGDERAEIDRTRVRLAQVGFDHIDQLMDAETIAPVVGERVRRSLHTRLTLAREAATSAGSLDDDYRHLRRTVVLVQRAELERLHETGEVSEATRRRLERQLDLEDARYVEET